MTSEPYQTIDQALVVAVPEFDDRVTEHLNTYGEVLPHVLFGDLSRFVLDAQIDGNEDLVQRCLAFLDRVLTGGDVAEQNLVEASFVENMKPWDPLSAPFIATWPEYLRSAAARQGWRDPGSSAER